MNESTRPNESKGQHRHNCTTKLDQGQDQWQDQELAEDKEEDEHQRKRKPTPIRDKRQKGGWNCGIVGGPLVGTGVELYN